MNRKIVLLICFIIFIIVIINFNTIFGILFPKETYIDVTAEETPYIKGGIIHIAVCDSESGEIINSKEYVNVTLVDQKSNTGSHEEYHQSSIYRYGGANDEAWKDLSVYGDYTISVCYPGEIGYKPCNITKNITINAVDQPKSHQSSESNSHYSYDMLAKGKNPSAIYSGEDEDYYIYVYHSNLPYGDNHIRINKHTGEII